MLTPCRITTRPLASVSQRPSCRSGGVGPAAAAGAAMTRIETRIASTLRISAEGNPQTRLPRRPQDGNAPTARPSGRFVIRERRWARPLLHDLAVGGDVISAAGLHHVVAAAAADLVMSVPTHVDGVAAGLTPDDVAACAAGQIVVVGAADHHVVAVLAVLDVVACAAVQDVVALAAVQNIVALIATEIVVALLAGDVVIALVAIELVVSLGAVQVVALLVALHVLALVVVVLALVVLVEIAGRGRRALVV